MTLEQPKNSYRCEACGMECPICLCTSSVSTKIPNTGELVKLSNEGLTDFEKTWLYKNKIRHYQRELNKIK